VGQRRSTLAAQEQQDKDTPAVGEFIITEHPQARTTVAVAAVALEHRDIIDTADIIKPVAAKEPL
jgi:hypothetical protein